MNTRQHFSQELFEIRMGLTCKCQILPSQIITFKLFKLFSPQKFTFQVYKLMFQVDSLQDFIFPLQVLQAQTQSLSTSNAQDTT